MGRTGDSLLMNTMIYWPDIIILPKGWEAGSYRRSIDRTKDIRSMVPGDHGSTLEGTLWSAPEQMQ